MPRDDDAVDALRYGLSAFEVAAHEVFGRPAQRMRVVNPPLQQVPHDGSRLWHDPRTSEDPEMEPDPENAFERRVQVYVLGGKNAAFQSPDKLGKDEYIWFVNKYYLEITTTPPKPGEETGNFLGYRYIGEPPEWWFWAVAREQVTETLVKDFDGYGYLVHRDARRLQHREDRFYERYPPREEEVDEDGFVHDPHNYYSSGHYYDGNSGMIGWSSPPLLPSPA